MDATLRPYLQLLGLHACKWQHPPYFCKKRETISVLTFQIGSLDTFNVGAKPTETLLPKVAQADQ